MKVPHPIPYQGSKRLLARTILSYFPTSIDTLYEPFAGSAAISLAAATRKMANRYALSDSLPPLAKLWQSIIGSPQILADQYETLWTEQHTDPRAYYLAMRTQFNEDGEPGLLLYLLARCVKNAVRFNADGEFNQSADHRRLGTNPKKMRSAITDASALFDKTGSADEGDYQTHVLRAGPDDLVYMDPPYQGVSNKNTRYANQLDVPIFVATLTKLNEAKVPYIVSYDGRCGEREYGPELPNHLDLLRLEIDAGISSQATLSGRKLRTIESLYLSEALLERIGRPLILTCNDISSELEPSDGSRHSLPV